MGLLSFVADFVEAKMPRLYAFIINCCTDICAWYVPLQHSQELLKFWHVPYSQLHYEDIFVLSRARPIRFFWADTDVFQFSLPMSDANTDIFVLLKQ